MEILKLIDTILANSQTIRWILVTIASALLVTCLVLYVSNVGKDLDITLLKTEVAKAGEALYKQNSKIKELGEKFNDQKKIMDEAVKTAAAIAVENRKQLRGITDLKLKGTCDEKVKQAFDAITP